MQLWIGLQGVMHNTLPTGDRGTFYQLSKHPNGAHRYVGKNGGASQEVVWEWSTSQDVVWERAPPKRWYGNGAPHGR